MASKGFRKLAEFDDPANVAAIKAALAKLDIPWDVHLHSTRGVSRQSFWRVYVLTTNLCCARAVLDSLTVRRITGLHELRKPK